MCRGTSFYRRPDVALIMGREATMDIARAVITFELHSFELLFLPLGEI